MTSATRASRCTCATGGQGYDVMGYTHTQLIDDVLDQYERHLEFLRLHDGSGV